MRLFILILFELSCTFALLPTLQRVSEELRPFGNTQNRFVRRSGSVKARLPTAIVPTHYDLGIIPYIIPSEEEYYLKAQGRVLITVTCLEDTNSITLHAVEIEIPPNRIMVTRQGGEDIEVLGLTSNATQETITIQLGASLERGGIYEVEIFFTSRVADDRMNGLYLSKYVDPNTGIVNQHVGTQFQAEDARKAFPCFDEPALKATFSIRVGRHATHTSLCNTGNDGVPIPIRYGPENYVYDVCHVTPVRMSTYLIAIAVMGGFSSHSHDNSIYTKPVTIWGPQAEMDQSDVRFTVDTVAKNLKFFETYMDHEYDFGKMDSVALGQFAFGAMENWGLNVYGLQTLLYKASDMTTIQKWRIAFIISHEISHQWFGNAVTMDWWTDLWLNEGLANYFEFLAAEDVVPEFAPLQRFTIDASQSALDFDGTPEAVPVHGNNETHFVENPSGATYVKAAALVRMMEGFLTPETLRRGLQRYLQATLYGIAHQDDLFEALTAQAQIDEIPLPERLTVKDIMDPWTLLTGFPLVRISRVSQNRIYISQERFKNDASLELEPHAWYLPITYTTKADPDPTDGYFLPKTWLKVNELLISHQVENTDEWILVNPDAMSFYRVLYDEHLTQLLIRQLNEDHTQISALSRGQLIDDYFKSAFGELISIKKALDFTSFLDKERELPVWVPVFNNIQKLHDLLSDDVELGMRFRAYFLEKLSPAFEFVGATHLPHDTPVTRMLREILLDWACALGHPLCFSTATEQVMEWMNSEDSLNPILPDYQPMIYCAAVSAGGETFSDFFLDLYGDSGSSARQRGLFLNAIACASIPALLTEALYLAVQETSGIRLEDATKMMGRIAESMDGRNVAFVFITTQLDLILSSRVGEQGIRAVMTSFAKQFATAERQDQVQTYLDTNRHKFSVELVGYIEDKISEIDANRRWLDVHREGLTQFFPADEV